MAEFNATFTVRWNRLLEAIRRGEASKKDRTGRRAFQSFEYFNARETQKRGALHGHAVVRPRDDVGTIQISQVLLSRLAMEHGFGHQVDVQRIGEPVRGKSRSVSGAAHYVAKYVSKSADDRPGVPWSGNGPATFRTWTASRGWGQTMKAVREAARHWAMASEAEGRDALVLFRESYAGTDHVLDESEALALLSETLSLVDESPSCERSQAQEKLLADQEMDRERHRIAMLQARFF